MSETLLSLEEIRVQYGSFLAVDNLSISLRAGELLGMIGPNGAGKTTTLRAAAGLQPVSTGVVRVLGEDVRANPERLGQHLGFSSDNPALYDNLTAGEFLEFIARCYGLPRNLATERIDHWLETLWLAEKRDSKISSLSRGMKQRLGVARTLLPDPHVILLDEPAAGLDPAGRIQFRQLLANLRDQGKALIVSSHILADLAEYCTHVAIMGHGRLLKFCAVGEITGGGAAQRYRVVFAQRIADLSARLEGCPALKSATRIEFDGDLLAFDIEGDRAAAAAILQDLVKAGLPVAEYRPQQSDLEQAYLRTELRQVD